MNDDAIAELLSELDTPVRQLALDLRALVREVVPDAVEEVDLPAKLIGFTFIPGTYKGLFAAVAPQRTYVNLMFSKGAELFEVDDTGLLEGSGKKARHIKVQDSGRLADPQVRALISEAARRTPRA
jgi:hypothetical protein